MAEDIDKLISWACSQGWRVERDAQGYRRFYAPDGTYVVRYAATPSNPGDGCSTSSRPSGNTGSVGRRRARRNSARCAGRVSSDGHVDRARRGRHR
jgi:hypothetical protein